MTTSSSQPVEPIEAPSKRYHDFDALRGFAMLLGIVMHGLLAYVVLPIWPAQDIHQNTEFYGFFQHGIHGFRMPLFFLISGFFTAMMWHKRGTKGLVKHRAKRILLPLVVGTILLWPPMIGIFIWSQAAREDQATHQEQAASETTQKDLWSASKEGDVEAIQLCLEEGHDPNKRDALRISPLEWAAMHDQADAISLLVEEGANINEKNHDGSTPLHSAAFLGSTAAAKRLIELGADPTIRNNTGQTPREVAQLDMGIVHFVGQMIGLKIKEEEVKAGKKEITGFLRELEDDGTQEEAPEEADSSRDPGQIVGGLVMLGIFAPVFHHLWFLYYLLWLVGIFLVAAWIWRRFPRRRIPGWLISTPGCLLWLIPLTCVPQFFMRQSFGVDTAAGVIPWPPKLFYYVIFFGFGAICYGRPEFEERAGRHWIVLFLCALPVLLAGIHFFHDRESDPTYGLVSLCAATYAWLVIFGMIGFFRRFFSGEHPRIRYLSDSAYWLYVAHLPLILALQVWVSNWDIHHFPKFLLVCTVTFVVLIVMYEYLVRYTFIGTLLNGKKVRPDKQPTAVSESGM